MIDIKYQKLVFAFFMALIMSCIMSLLISIFNVGLSNLIIEKWLSAWRFAFLVAFPTIMVVVPQVQKLMKILIKNTNN
jgi:hypothetical protein